jgi:pyruvate dehydrogenase E1 component alpha subunit
MAHERATSEPEIYKKLQRGGMAGVEVVYGHVLWRCDAWLKRRYLLVLVLECPTLIERALTYRFRGVPRGGPDAPSAPQSRRHLFPQRHRLTKPSVSLPPRTHSSSDQEELSA